MIAAEQEPYHARALKSLAIAKNVANDLRFSA
jgi:hypothetical protein